MSSSAQKLPLDPPRVRIVNTQDSVAVQLLAKAYLPLYQPGPVGAQGCLVCNLSSILTSWLVIAGHKVDCALFAYASLENPGLRS